MKIAFLYEHPTWSEKLIDCFHNNDINLQLINIDELTFDQFMTQKINYF